MHATGNVRIAKRRIVVLQFYEVLHRQLLQLFWLFSLQVVSDHLGYGVELLALDVHVSY